MLRNIRKILAVAVFAVTTLLFLDFTGTLHLWFGWLARVQLIPAILAVNVVVLVLLLLLTIVFGRIYCSVICPLGIFQDGVSNLSGRRKGYKNRFRYSRAKGWLRYGVLAALVAAMVAGISVVVSLLDPYAAFGRIASNLLAPVYRLGNNVLATLAESINSYAFYSTDVWIKGWATFAVAVITVAAAGILAWLHGRTYCNTVCPVGTFLGFIAKYSFFKPVIDKTKCVGCELCARNCKSSCINSKEHQIDYSRCVTCFNCIDKCKGGAVTYSFALCSKKATAAPASEAANSSDGSSRRNILSLLGIFALTPAAVKAQQLLINVDGGLAPLEDKKAPARQTPIVPPGAEGAAHFTQHCTACQLCVSACPNNVLRPSNKLVNFMQPEMSYERGYCRPECVECSLVCPTGAINTLTVPEKSVTAIGRAVVIEQNCIVRTDNVQCNLCEVQCPPQAIIMRKAEPGTANSLLVPAVDIEKCTGCGACEHLCPARPLSAIYVEGNVKHHEIW